MNRTTYTERALIDLHQYLGIRGQINRFQHIVVSESDFKRLVAETSAIVGTRWPTADYRSPTFTGVPIETAPDWTFDPVRIAWLRILATLMILLRLRKIVTWINNLLTTEPRR
ncbi:MAG: hypothetical protein ABJB03_00430 [Rhodoglobus sp.]